MGRELLLLRHGKSDWRVEVDDFHRPLKGRGKRGARRIGLWLAQQGWLPDHVISSPAVRALATAQRCCEAMGLATATIREDERVYLASLQQLLTILADCPPHAHRLLLVGHNPGLEQLLGYLADALPPRRPDGKLLPTATLARLAMPDDWEGLRRGQGRLLDLTRAADLPEV